MKSFEPTGHSEATRRSSVRAVAVATATNVVCTLPIYLTGALAVELSRDLSLGAQRLGIAVAVFRGTGVLTARALGGAADKLGATVALRLAISGSAISCLGVGMLAQDWMNFLAWIALAGVAKALSQPAANRLLVYRVRSSRQGMAFGIKQTAAPVSSMLAGLSVPIVALTIGWRWAYLLVGVLSVAVIVLIGRRPTTAVDSRTAASTVISRRRGTLLTMAVAFGLSTMASSSIAIFFVDSAVAAGVRDEVAGVLLAVASGLAIGTRMSTGWLSDRRESGHLTMCALLLLVGTTGLILVATGNVVGMGVGVSVAMAGTWGTSAAFWYATTRLSPSAPGRVTGAVAPGGMLGGVAGPVGFGFLAERFSYPAAWGTLALAALMAAASMAYAGRSLSACQLRSS